MADYLKIIDDFEKEWAASRRFTWLDFHPGMDPDEWQVKDGTDGVTGKKITGTQAGTVFFFIPTEALRLGPEEWRRAHPGPVQRWTPKSRRAAQPLADASKDGEELCSTKWGAI